MYLHRHLKHKTNNFFDCSFFNSVKRVCFLVNYSVQMWKRFKTLNIKENLKEIPNKVVIKPF